MKTQRKVSIFGYPRLLSHCLLIYTSIFEKPDPIQDASWKSTVSAGQQGAHELGNGLAKDCGGVMLSSMDGSDRSELGEKYTSRSEEDMCDLTTYSGDDSDDSIERLNILRIYHFSHKKRRLCAFSCFKSGGWK
eukprot:GHVU01008608.1.p2 GENE.GHVU01008608.1~~GHVU01008608.1.p2  ORF type:complete len:134 (-),score=6.98 GHVU01008608.1:109-510(-)